MDRQNAYEWLRLINCLGCGSARIWEIMNSFGTVSEACACLDGDSAGSGLFREKELNSASRTSPEQLGELISYCESHNIYILTWDDEIYPQRLRTIYNPPVLLFCRGDLSCLENEFSLSVVGTRKPSDYSVRVTAALVKELAGFGITIASGFAVGIDIAASLAAVRAGGKTIAVLGCGLDVNYPPDNVRYRSEIEQSGLFVSEYYPLMVGTRSSFPARNRILSGLSLGTIVAEAGVKSGALITANLALGQGRDIFAIAPHDLFDPRYGGNVSLIRDGAVCLCGVRDIMYEYYENYGHKIANADAVFSSVSGGKPVSAKSSAETADTLSEKVMEVREEEQSAEEFDASELGDEEALVYGALKKAGRPVQANDLAEMCGMDISEMMSVLTDLEIEGAVTSSAGQHYSAN